MNLIKDKWIPVIREDETQDTISPFQISEIDNPVIEINAPRPDFQGALYQFLIGLLQTCLAPADEDDWLEFWNEFPKIPDVKIAFNRVADAFELFNPDGPAFMQDFDLPGGEHKSISTLLIEAPGAKTVRVNFDHFIKRSRVKQMCPGCTATALFTLQINAPSGGQGNRVGLRGGGPLTTLVVPNQTHHFLWHKLWINILNSEEIEKAQQVPDYLTLPWLGRTRESSKKGSITIPEMVHPIHMYWSMPRRIRLNPIESENGDCDICGASSTKLFKSYRAKNYGFNYDGAWVHPLTPYRFDDEHKNPPLSLKGQKGGLGYRHWLGLAFQDPVKGEQAAAVVRFYNEDRINSIQGQAGILWCFGFDMDNMKARCWYDTQLPLFYLDPKQRINLIDWTGQLIQAAREALKLLKTEIKSAWFQRPKDAKGDMSMIDGQFWESTEPIFYKILEQTARLSGDTRMAPASVYQLWYKTLEKQVFSIFEKMTMETAPENLELQDIVLAREWLKKKFYGNKLMKSIKKNATEEVEI